MIVLYSSVHAIVRVHMTKNCAKLLGGYIAKFLSTIVCIAFVMCFLQTKYLVLGHAIQDSKALLIKMTSSFLVTWTYMNHHISLRTQ